MLKPGMIYPVFIKESRLENASLRASEMTELI